MLFTKLLSSYQGSVYKQKTKKKESEMGKSIKSQTSSARPTDLQVLF